MKSLNIPLSSLNLSINISTAFFSISMPIQFLPSCWAATIVVAQPQKGSNTKSPELEEANIKGLRRASGFCVG